jgi:hypothetical protein
VTAFPLCSMFRRFDIGELGNSYITEPMPHTD